MYKKIAAAAALLAITAGVAAQTQDDDKLDRAMTLEREYDPTVQDADKVNQLPQPSEPQIVKRSIEYSPFASPADPGREITPLSAGNIMTDIPYNRRRGYLRLGGGMYMNLNADAGYHIIDDGTTRLNAYVSHRSTNGKIKYYDYWNEEKQPMKLNDNLVGLHFGHRFEQGAHLRLGGAYRHDAFNYYGYPHNRIPMPALPSAPDSFDRTTNQANQTIRAYAGVRSSEGARIGYLLDVEFARFTQRYARTKELRGVRESNLTAQGGISFNLDDEATRTAGIGALVNTFSYTYDYPPGASGLLYYRNHAELTVSPYYLVRGDGWHLRIGANLMLLTGDSARIFLSPDLAAEAQIAPRTRFYLTARGGIRSNDPYRLASQNRYLDHTRIILPSRTWLDAEIGIRSGVAHGVWFDIFGGYRITANDLFFVPSVAPKANDFGAYQYVVQPNVSHLRVGAAIKYRWMKTVDFDLKAVYNHRTLKAGDDGQAWADMKPYGAPTFELDAGLTVRPMAPLAIDLRYYLGTGRFSYLTLDRREVVMPNLNDLSATATWNLNNTVGLYLKAGNLLFQRQELFYGYPLQGFRLMGGVNLNF